MWGGDSLSPLSLILGDWKARESNAACLFRNKATRRPTMVLTTSYSSSTATVSSSTATVSRRLAAGFWAARVDLAMITQEWHGAQGGGRLAWDRRLGGHRLQGGSAWRGCLGLRLTAETGLGCLEGAPRPLTRACPVLAGVRTEQDLYVRLIDSVTKQVSPRPLGFSSPVSDSSPQSPQFVSDLPLLHYFLDQTPQPPLQVPLPAPCPLGNFFFSVSPSDLFCLTQGNPGGSKRRRKRMERKQLLGDSVPPNIPFC